MRYATDGQQVVQLPWGNDDAEGLQHISCTESLLRVQHQKLSNQAHRVLRHATVPERVGVGAGTEWVGTGSGKFYLQSMTLSHKLTKPQLKDLLFKQRVVGFNKRRLSI